MKLRRLMAILIAATIFSLILTVMPTAIFADTVYFDGYLSTDKTFTRPNFDLTPKDSGTYSYFAKRLVPDVNGTYEIEILSSNPAGLDTAMFLYETCFKASDPTTNLIAADDDGAGYPFSKIVWDMTAGQKYVVVISTYSNEMFGWDVYGQVFNCGPGIVSISNNVLCPSSKAEEAVMEEPMWERGDQKMVCASVWVNDNGCFEFVFFYEYADNNHVMIYDTDGNEVFAIDMPYGKASFEACLGDGTYTVKTFHDDMSTPLQEFTISKP